MIDFTSLVGDKSAFYSEYFGRKPLLRRAAITNPDGLLNASELDNLINLEVVRPPYIKLNLDGRGVPEKGYTRSVVVQGVNVTDAVVAEKVYELFKAGATVTWSSLNHVLPKMRALADVVNTELAVRTDPVAFLTPAGKKGYPPHHDPVDLFIIQLAGTKKWKLWDLPNPRKGDNESYTLQELGDPSSEFLMTEGDVLYLPYGTPHAATAEDRTSLHLSVMMRPRMWSDLILELVKEIVQNDHSYREYPLLARQADSSTMEEFATVIEKLRSQLSNSVAPEILEDLRKMPETQGGHTTGNTFEAVMGADALAADAGLVRTDLDISVLDIIEGRTHVAVNGSTLAMPTVLAEHLTALKPGAPLALESIPIDDSRRLALAKKLVRLELVRAVS